MSTFGKKFLSAFVEINDNGETKESPQEDLSEKTVLSDRKQPSTAPDNRLAEHFSKLLSEATVPDAGYYPFSKMLDAMQGIGDEHTRYSAAFAGLQVNGMHKEKLLSSARHYAALLASDAEAFNSTIHDALEEKVGAKKREIETTKIEIESLAQRIVSLQQHIDKLAHETEENEAKIYSRQQGYAAAQEAWRQRIENDITKIQQHII